MIKETLTELMNQTAKPVASPAPVAIDDSSRIVAVKDGYKLQVLDVPVVKARRHNFHDLDSFAGFAVDRYGAADGQRTSDVIVDVGMLTLDAGPNSDLADVVTCDIAQHPRWRRWRQLLNVPLTQRVFARAVRTALEDFPDSVSRDGVKLGSAGKDLLTQLSKMGVAGTSEFTCEIGQNGEVIASGRNASSSVSATIPVSFTLCLPVMKGAKKDGQYVSYDVEVFIELDVANGPPKFTLSTPGFDVVWDKALDDAATYLGHIMPGFLLSRGSYNSAELDQPLVVTAH